MKKCSQISGPGDRFADLIRQWLLTHNGESPMILKYKNEKSKSSLTHDNGASLLIKDDLVFT